MRWRSIIWAMPILMLALSACASNFATTTTDACVWLKPVIPDKGFETRWTRGEKQQVLVLDQDVQKFCPIWGAASWGQK